MFSVKLIDDYFQQQNIDVAPTTIKTGSRDAGALGNLCHVDRSRPFFHQQRGCGLKHRRLVAGRSATWTLLLHGSMLTQTNLH
jgi:hypothetical protein